MDIKEIKGIHRQKHKTKELYKAFIFSVFALLGAFNFFSQQILTTTKSDDSLAQAVLCSPTEVQEGSNSSAVLQNEAPVLNEDISLFAGCGGFLE